MEEDQIEYVLMTKREVNIYQIPPSQTARGHSVEDWRGKQMGKGKAYFLNF